LELQLPTGYRSVSVNATVAGYCAGCREPSPGERSDP
jgi:hypothetical protein